MPEPKQNRQDLHQQPDSQPLRILFLDLYEPSEDVALEAVHSAITEQLKWVSYQVVTIKNWIDFEKHFPRSGPSPEFEIHLAWLSGNLEMSPGKYQWERFFDVVDTLDRYSTQIIIFGFESGVSEPAKGVMDKGGFSFAYPFNADILFAYIRTEATRIDRYNRLDGFQKHVLDMASSAESLRNIIKFIVGELDTNPAIGFVRATITLIGPGVEEGKHQRYLCPVESESAYKPEIRRTLIKAIEGGSIGHNLSLK